MKMKKNNIFAVFGGLAVVIVLIVVFLMVNPNPGIEREAANTTGTNGHSSAAFDAAAGTNGHSPAASDARVGATDDSSAASDVMTITFVVPDICRIDDDHLKLFNDELVNDGFPYALDIKYIEYEKYAAGIEKELKTGNADVAFLGLGDADGNNNIYSLINSGSVCKLDEVLASEEGQMLYDAFPEALWEAVKCDHSIYSIPSALAQDYGSYVAFNRDYIEEDVIESWDGTMEGIYEILKNVEWDDSIAPRFQYLCGAYSYEDMIGCEIRYGLLFDYDTLTVENPMESEKFTGFLSVMDEMKREGYLDSSVSYVDNPGLNSSGVRQSIESGNYVVALRSGKIDDGFIRDNICVKRVTPYLSSRINGSIGISKHTEDMNAVVEFLGLFYSNEKYGNLLMYGAENEDYKVVDGIAYNMDGTDLYDNYLTKLCLDLFINIYPVKGENFPNNRREEYFSYYDSIELSPFIGFEPDTGNMNNISNELDAAMTELAGINDSDTTDEKAEAFEDRISAVSARLKSGGMDAYLDSVRKQWEEYQK